MMSFRRIQKLLYSPEYGELEDIVVLESPFAQTTPEGKGIRQVQIALTPTKFILAQDIFDENTLAENSKDDKKINLETVTVSPDVDAEIESLELVSIIPINLVTLSIFVQGRKRALKARLRNGQVYYFELGGSCHRKMLWKLWSDKVKSMSPGAPISSSSETATTNSSSHASACIGKKFSRTTSSHECRPSKVNDKCPKDTKMLRSCKTKLPSKRKPWTDRNLFPTEIDDDDGKGESFAMYKSSKAEELSKNLQVHDQCKGDSAEKSDDKLSWSVSRQVELNLINERQMMSVIPRRKKMATSRKKVSQRSILVNRFDSGVSENCKLGLYLAPLDGANDDQFKQQSSADFINPTDAGVLMWEECTDARRKRKSYSLHSCNFVAFPHFYNGLGPAGNHISLEEKRLLQLRRTKSVFQLKNANSDEMCLPIPKHQLTATISYDNLTLPLIEKDEQKRYEKLLRKFPCSPLHLTGIRFWMPDLSCQSSSAKYIYHKQRRILENLQGRRICSQGKSKEISAISAMSSKTVYGHNSAISKLLSEGDKAKRRRCNTVYEKEIRRKICISGEENLRCEHCCCKLTGQNQDMNNLTTFQSMLKFHIKIFARDFTSTTLAYQLTMIDRDLFLQIPVSELGLIIYQKYHLKEKSFLYPFASLHNGTPGISALISFSHRISCLVSSAVLEEESIKERARSIVHFINIAHKCFQLQNFQSCRSILLGLQSPAIFRLRETWKYVKRKNYNKYQTFRHLCRFYINVQMTGYSGITKSSRRIPFLPCINFILNYLQETKLKIEIVNESYMAKSSKGSGQKIEMDMQNAIGDDAKGFKKEPDFLHNENAERNVPKVHCSKFISFLSTVFRSNKKQKNFKRQYSGTVDTIWERSPTVTVDNHSKGKINDCFSFTGINDNTLKLYLSSVGKDSPSSEIDQEKNSNFHREVGYSHECVLENLLEIFKKTSETLISSQYCAFNYALPQSDLAKEYILKAKYKEHLQNYKLSLRVENL